VRNRTAVVDYVLSVHDPEQRSPGDAATACCFPVTDRNADELLLTSPSFCFVPSLHTTTHRRVVLPSLDPPSYLRRLTHVRAESRDPSRQRRLFLTDETDEV
jgi:hypothetical protein